MLGDREDLRAARSAVAMAGGKPGTSEVERWEPPSDDAGATKDNRQSRRR
jgi:hypothetical protein